LQLYWVGPMLGAAVGALLYDKVFSTKMCKSILGGCNSGSYNSNSVEETNDDESTVEDSNENHSKQTQLDKNKVV